MNVKYLVIGAVVIILMIAFGRNPVEESRKAREKAMEGKDPLVTAIEEHNTKRHSYKSMLSGNGGTSTMSRPVGSGGGGTMPMTPNYIPKDGANPFQQTSPTYAPQQQQPQESNSYYPPPPQPNSTYYNNFKGKNNRRAPQQLPPRSALEGYLPSGQRITFLGPQIVSYDEAGNKLDVPDGEYVLSNGVPIIIKNGKRIVYTN